MKIQEGSYWEFHLRKGRWRKEKLLLDVRLFLLYGPQMLLGVLPDP